MLSFSISDVCELELETEISEVVQSENKSKQEWTCFLKLNNEKSASVSISFKDVAIDNQKLSYVFISDISDLKNTQKELNDRRLLIRGITEQTPNIKIKSNETWSAC